MSDIDSGTAELLIQKLRDGNVFLTQEDKFEFLPDKVLWKNACPACGKDMDFHFGDFPDEYLDGSIEVEFCAWCVDKECCGHIDCNGMVC